MKIYIVAYNPICIARMKSFIRWLDSSYTIEIFVLVSERLIKLSQWEDSLTGIPNIQRVSTYSDQEALDFSAYKMALVSHLHRCSDEGAVVVNDTLFTKHYSRRGILELLEKANLVEDAKITAPVLIGPHRNSEFATIDPRIKEFVATYMYYANSSACAALLDSFCELEEFIAKNTGLIGAYHAQIASTPYPTDLLAPKLNAFCLERIFTRRVTESGVVWFSNFGFRIRLITALECQLSRLALKLKTLL